MARRTQGPDPEIDFSDADDLASVVRVGRNEDVAAICGRVDTSPTFAVVVHAPDGNRALASELGIRRLQRHAEEAGKMVAIATGSVSLASRARQAGIPVARRPDQIRWDAGGRRVLSFFGWSMRLPAVGRYVQYVFLIAAIVAIAGVALAVGPSGKVVAYPPTDTLERLVTITADPEATEIDFDALTVPAQTVSASQTLTLATKTTGTISAGVQTAKVEVRITNPSGQEVTIPAGTVVLTSVEGLTFQLEADVTVAARGDAVGQAVCNQKGTAGNVAAGTVTGFQDERYESLTVTNEAPATGGTNESRPAVAPEDLTTLQQLAEDIEASETIHKLLAEARPEDTVFLQTAEAEIEEGEPSANAGEEATVVLLPVTVTVKAHAVTAETLDELARTVLAGEQGVGSFIPGTVSAVETGATQVDNVDGKIRTSLRIRGEFARDIDEGSIKDAVKGKSEGSARSTLLERYGIQESEVSVTPGWAPWFPRFGFRITVELKAKTPESATPASDDSTPDDASETPTPTPGS